MAISPSSTMSPPLLPSDVYLEILKHLPISRDDPSSVVTLVSCLQANSKTRSAALSSPLWKPHYQVRYTHCDDTKETQRRDDAKGNWRLLYFARRRLDLRALQLADTIRLDSTCNRLEVARVFTKELSFDVWDALRLESQIQQPLCFRRDETEEEDESDVEPEAVPRRFWAETILGLIARNEAVKRWGNLLTMNGDAQSLTFEDSMASLSSVFNVSAQEVRCDQ